MNLTPVTNACPCPFCGLELPTPRTLQLHEARCLTRLRLMQSPEAAWSQFEQMFSKPDARQTGRTS